MGDNDTRTDAKRLALLNAKRLALEQAGHWASHFRRFMADPSLVEQARFT